MVKKKGELVTTRSRSIFNFEENRMQEVLFYKERIF